MANLQILYQSCNSKKESNNIYANSEILLEYGYSLLAMELQIVLCGVNSIHSEPLAR